MSPQAEPPSWNAIVLAAGAGTRMKSNLPKVLHRVAGRPLVSWVVDAALTAGAEHCFVVVGHGRTAVERELENTFGDAVRCVLQPEQLGTGHAVGCVLDAETALTGRVLVAYGDCPLIPSSLMSGIVGEADRGQAAVGLVTATLEQPAGYGRILRDASGSVLRIVEDRDCTAAQRSIDEINPGLYAFDLPFLRSAVAALSTENAQGELYLTDVVEQAASRGSVATIAAFGDDILGVNDPRDLAICAGRARRRIAEALALSGVSVTDLDALYVDASCEVEAGAALGAQVHLRGRCVVRAGATIDTGCVLTDVVVEADARVLPYSVAVDSTIGRGANVGPFSHLRPKTRLGPRSKVGNFSETKNTTVGEGSKVNHLSYVGDGQIGSGVNIGAGTIFCNYDGERKHTTVLEDGVFIGSDSQLIAPLTVGRGAYVASGTTVTRNVPEDALAVSRTKQENKEGYAARLRASLRGTKKD